MLLQCRRSKDQMIYHRISTNPTVLWAWNWKTSKLRSRDSPLSRSSQTLSTAAPERVTTTTATRRANARAGGGSTLKGRGLERKDGWTHWKIILVDGSCRSDLMVNLWKMWLELFQLWLVRPTDPYWELKPSQQQEAVDMGPNLRTYLGKAWEGYILVYIYIILYPMGTKISQFLFCSLLHG